MLKLNHDTPERNVVLFHPKMLLHSGVTSNFVKGIFCNFVKCGYFLPKQLWSTSSSFSHVWWIFYFWNSNIFSDFKVISKKKRCLIVLWIYILRVVESYSRCSSNVLEQKFCWCVPHVFLVPLRRTLNEVSDLPPFRILHSKHSNR